MTSRLILILFTIILQFNYSCTSQTTTTLPPPNIVWITSEDNSKHYMDLFDEHGAKTPNIEKLAENGVIYSHAFSNAAVCSAARSTLISGSYGPRLATHYHRKLQKVPMPNGIEMFPYYLRKAGYYTTNNAKEDYNIIKSDSVWDDSSKKANWRNRKEDQPFFHVFNIGTTHEGKLHFTEVDMKKGTKTDPDSCFVLPNHPQTPLFKYTNAYYHDKIKEMDTEVGEVLNQLKKDGLLENTFIFYFGDHGGVLPGSKGYINEMGVHIPLVVYIPPNYKGLVDEKPGSKSEGFVSFIDFGPTVLNLAGVTIPENIDGKPFLGHNITNKAVSARDETFSYADRFDEKYDMVRALRKGKYKYVRNYQTFNYDGLMNQYRYKQLGYKEWKQLFKERKLNAVQSQFFQVKQPEALYDIEADPYETNNLANNPEFAPVLKGLRDKLNARVESMPDLSFYPEFYLIKNAFDNPVDFGQKHKSDIKKYIDIANLSLQEFENVKDNIKKGLSSNDAWARYWTLITCSNFGERASIFNETIKSIAQTDTEQINRVRAAEFLGLTGIQNPVNTMTKALYTVTDGAEALLILNSMVLMKDGINRSYTFNIIPEKLKKQVSENQQVMRRIEYFTQS
ncbi:sulfatase [Tamlana sp. 2201CG12-4]|uniref:sulfatase family protein n=1 Tax=Tamlana sp. 2201CG12-4 TaxID=3112582 RepID=UPI002DB743BB|nr:sulfatase [Tamlana sp. 2201CG12-4]MEC3908405.1 sulfatase [Tamlana sp. 2201CG12-4]